MTPRASGLLPRDHPRLLPDDHPRHLGGDHRAAEHPPGPRLLDRRPLLGPERLHPHLRRPASARRPRRRHPRPPPRLHRRHRPLHLRLDAWRPRPVAGLAARRPRPAGRRRRHRRPVDPCPAHRQLSRGPRTDAGGRLVQRRRRSRRQHRPPARRDAHLLDLLALRALHQRPARSGADLGRAALPA